MNAGEWGKLTTMLILAAVFLYSGYRLLRPVFVRLRLRRVIRRWNRYRKEQQHEEAIELNRIYDRVNRHREWVKAVRADIAKEPVPPILNQSEKWRDNARKAEALGFMDDESPRPAA